MNNQLMSKFVTLIGRKVYYQADLDSRPDDGYGSTRPPESSLDDPRANLVSSELANGMHAPCIDIDYEAHLVPSATPGHYHLYLDKELTWEQYSRVLRVMAEVGLIESGYYEASRRRGASFVRLPHVLKKLKGRLSA